MKRLFDYAEHINKCSKCGLCQSVCPVYKITGNDCAVSRGKFVMLDGVIKGDLQVNKNIEKYLDMCLKCGKCQSFCPSNINVCEIFNAAKYECVHKNLKWNFIRFLQSRFIFSNVLTLFRKLVPRRKFAQKGKIKLLYFKGCANEFYPKTENSLKKIFESLDVEIIEKDFDCCGLPLLSSGNLERFEDVKVRNLNLMDCDYDYIITDCASCESTLKGYGVRNLIQASDFLAKQDIKFVFEKKIRITFHKPCHLEDEDSIRRLFEKCENVEYIEMKDYENCCGFAGMFALKNPEISKKLSREKVTNAIATGADYVLTACPACILGLHQGFVSLKKKPQKIMNVLDFLAEAQIKKAD